MTEPLNKSKIHETPRMQSQIFIRELTWKYLWIVSFLQLFQLSIIIATSFIWKTNSLTSAHDIFYTWCLSKREQKPDVIFALNVASC